MIFVLIMLVVSLPFVIPLLMGLMVLAGFFVTPIIALLTTVFM